MAPIPRPPLTSLQTLEDRCEWHKRLDRVLSTKPSPPLTTTTLPDYTSTRLSRILALEKTPATRRAELEELFTRVDTEQFEKLEREYEELYMEIEGLMAAAA